MQACRGGAIRGNGPLPWQSSSSSWGIAGAPHSGGTWAGGTWAGGCTREYGAGGRAPPKSAVEPKQQTKKIHPRIPKALADRAKLWSDRFPHGHFLNARPREQGVRTEKSCLVFVLASVPVSIVVEPGSAAEWARRVTRRASIPTSAQWQDHQQLPFRARLQVA